MTDNGVVNLSQAAEILGMRRTNVARFLERRGVAPVVETPWRRRWNRSDVEAAHADYVASGRMEADARRSESARRNLE